MTTFVVDLNSGIIAVDSRHSNKRSDELIFSVDSDADKIVEVEDHIFIFAGHGPTSDCWREWLNNEDKGLPPFPPMIDEKPHVVICAVSKTTRKIEFLFGNKDAWICDEDAKVLIAGTGRLHAKKEWDNTRDAMRAVQEAKRLDGRTGGETKFFNIYTGDNNLSRKMLPAYVLYKKIIRSSGIVMFDLGGSIEYKISPDMPNSEQIYKIIKEMELTANEEEYFYRTWQGRQQVEEWIEPYKSEVCGALSKIFPEKFS